MATDVPIVKRVYFQVESFTNTEWYYVTLSADLTDAEVKAELKKRGYINIETRYITTTWP
jgi:beta-lactamase class D